MKKSIVLVGLLAAALMMVPAAAKAEMYIEGYLGGVGIANDSNTWKFDGFKPSTPGRFDNPFFTGGVKLGAWFDKTGVTSAVNWPDWAKYFGFYMDLNYHNATFTDQMFLNNAAFMWKSSGRMATLAFMFAARYGFYPDSVVPFGRLQPYIAVGPAVVFSSQRANLLGTDLPSRSSTDIALAVEAGVRYMALKNVSLDLSFKYRWTEPSYSYFNGAVKLEPTYNVFIGALGAAYHF
jgi:opacity protein-like surface antigen